jgi:hypothetical protein
VLRWLLHAAQIFLPVFTLVRLADLVSVGLLRGRRPPSVGERKGSRSHFFFFLSRSGGRWLVRPTSFLPRQNLRSCSTDSALTPQWRSQSLLSAPSRFIFYHFHSCGSSSLLALWNCHHRPRYFFFRSAHQRAKVHVRG